MKQLRKTNNRNSGLQYKTRPLIRISKSKQARFVVSKSIAARLQMDVSKEALMFGIKNKQLHVFKEEKATDNYHLGPGDASTYRFRSMELYSYLKAHFGYKDDEEYYLEMNENFTFFETKIV